MDGASCACGGHMRVCLTALYSLFGMSSRCRAIQGPTAHYRRIQLLPAARRNRVPAPGHIPDFVPVGPSLGLLV